MPRSGASSSADSNAGVLTPPRRRSNQSDSPPLTSQQSEEDDSTQKEVGEQEGAPEKYKGIRALVAGLVSNEVINSINERLKSVTDIMPVRSKRKTAVKPPPRIIPPAAAAPPTPADPHLSSDHELMPQASDVFQPASSAPQQTHTSYPQSDNGAAGSASGKKRSGASGAAASGAATSNSAATSGTTTAGNKSKNPPSSTSGAKAARTTMSPTTAAKNGAKEQPNKAQTANVAQSPDEMCSSSDNEQKVRRVRNPSPCADTFLMHGGDTYSTVRGRGDRMQLLDDGLGATHNRASRGRMMKNGFPATSCSLPSSARNSDVFVASSSASAGQGGGGRGGRGGGGAHHQTSGSEAERADARDSILTNHSDTARSISKASSTTKFDYDGSCSEGGGGGGSQNMSVHPSASPAGGCGSGLYEDTPSQQREARRGGFEARGGNTCSQLQMGGGGCVDKNPGSQTSSSAPTIPPGIRTDEAARNAISQYYVDPETGSAHVAVMVPPGSGANKKTALLHQLDALEKQRGVSCDGVGARGLEAEPGDGSLLRVQPPTRGRQKQRNTNQQPSLSASTGQHGGGPLTSSAIQAGGSTQQACTSDVNTNVGTATVGGTTATNSSSQQNLASTPHSTCGTTGSDHEQETNEDSCCDEHEPLYNHVGLGHSMSRENAQMHANPYQICRVNGQPVVQQTGAPLGGAAAVTGMGTPGGGPPQQVLINNVGQPQVPGGLQLPGQGGPQQGQQHQRFLNAYGEEQGTQPHHLQVIDHEGRIVQDMTEQLQTMARQHLAQRQAENLLTQPNFAGQQQVGGAGGAGQQQMAAGGVAAGEAEQIFLDQCAAAMGTNLPAAQGGQPMPGQQGGQHPSHGNAIPKGGQMNSGAGANSAGIVNCAAHLQGTNVQQQLQNQNAGVLNQQHSQFPTIGLSVVGFTGVDDSVCIRTVCDLSQEYPFIEWGILFHPEKQGKPRYASIPWLHRLRDEVETRQKILSTQKKQQATAAMAAARAGEAGQQGQSLQTDATGNAKAIVPSPAGGQAGQNLDGSGPGSGRSSSCGGSGPHAPGGGGKAKSSTYTVRLAAHLCGEHCVKVLRGESSWIRSTLQEQLGFTRVQLNPTKQNGVDGAALGGLRRFLKSFRELLTSMPDMEFVLQVNRQTRELAFPLMDAPVANLAFLYDPSCGAGKVPPRRPIPVGHPGVLVGYAGGLGPHNLQAELKKIMAAVVQSPSVKYKDERTIWLDMESSLRKTIGGEQKDVFDVEQCNRVIAQLYDMGVLRADE